MVAAVHMVAARQGAVHMVAAVYIWWLLGLALKRPWLAPGGPPHALTAWTGLENTTLTLQRAGILQERLLGL